MGKRHILKIASGCPEDDIKVNKTSVMKSMKRIAATLTALVLCVSMANAGIRFGIKAGLNVNELHLNQKTFDASNRAGFTVGAMTEIVIPVIGLGFDASLMYTRMNSELDRETVSVFDNASSVTTYNKENVGKNFIEIPINLKYKFNIPAVASLVKPYVFTGPSFAFKLDGNTVKAFKTKTCQVAWNVGIGVELINHLQIGGSYGFGVNNIAKNWVDAKGIKVKNNYWTVTAAWLF